MEDNYEEEEWYVLKDTNENEGPLSLRDIDALYKTHVVRSNTLVWKDGMENWKPLYKVDTLNKLINEAVAEAEHIPDMSNQAQEPKDTTPNKELEKQQVKKQKVEEGKQAQDINDGSLPPKEEIEEMATKAIEILEGHEGLLDRPDEDLTKEEKQLKQQEREKLLRKEKKKRYRKNKAKKKWYKAKINTNIYINGLPPDITADELDDHFAK